MSTTNHIGTLIQQTFKQWPDAKDDFGALGDGFADDTAAIQAALTATAASHGFLYIPAGTYKITSTLTLTQAANFTIRGASKGGTSTTLKWSGPQGGTMLLLDGVRETEWSDMTLDGNLAAVEPAVIIEIDKVAVGTTQPRKNGFRRMLLRGGTVATVRIAHTSAVNNEAHVFEDVDVASVTALERGVTVRYGYQVENINAKNIQIVRGVISGKSTAVQIDEGSIHLHSVELSGNGTWVSVSGGGEPITIENCDGDSSERFLHMRPSQTNPVFATGNRFVQFGDGDILTLENSSGPLVLMSNDFSSGGYREGATTTISGNGPRAVILGNVFPNAGMVPFPDPTTARFSGLYALGNEFYGPGGVLTTMDDVLVPHRASGGPQSSLLLSGATGHVAEAVTITNSTNNVVPIAGVVALNVTADATLVTTPTIVAGRINGQTMLLLNVGTKSVTLQDRGTLASSGIALTASTLTIGPRQSVSFTWSATLSLWIQTGPLVAPL